MSKQFNPAEHASSTRRAAPIVGLAAVFVAMTALQGDALASRPPECTSGSGLNGYNSGYQLQTNLLRYIWESSYDCDTLEDYIRAVDVPFDPSSSSTYLACRNAGIADGIRSSIEYYQTQCVVACAVNGADVGSLNGRIYCGVPVTYSLTGELKVCDYVSEQACRGALTSYANSYCPEKKAADPKFDEFLGYACAF